MQTLLPTLVNSRPRLTRLKFQGVESSVVTLHVTTTVKNGDRKKVLKSIQP